MRLICKTCKIEITDELVELKDLSLVNENEGEDYIPTGYFIIGDGKYDINAENKVIINIKDLINSKLHSDRTRLYGCCGIDGLDGINRVCVNNHEIGTESSDCWMAHYIAFEPDFVEWI